MRNDMSSIRIFQIFLFFLGALLLLLAWEYRNFASLLMTVVVVLSLIVSFSSKVQSTLIPLISVFAVLAVADVALPVILSGSQELTQNDQTTGYASGGYYERINGFGYRPNPGVYTHRKLTSEDDVIYDVVYTIGEDGYRNDIQTTDFAAYIYGGSFTFGEGLNDNETLSFYLLHNHGISSKNVGVHGYGMHQALYNIEQGLVPQRENVVNILVTAPWHALRSSCKPSYAAGTPKYELTEEGIYLNGVCAGRGFAQRVLRRSNVFQLVASLIEDINVITDSDINLYIEIIKEIARHTEENNSNLVIAYIDATEEWLATTKWSNDSIIAELSNFATVLDVTLAETREKLDPRFYIHELDMHPSAIANEYRAAIIASHLENIEWPNE